jgi:hypothetical protein
MHDMVMKLDEWGQPAWLGLMVVSFILFWPIGLGVLAYLLWSGRMGCGWNRTGRREWQSRMADRMDEKMETWGRSARETAQSMRSSGNHAFDEYRVATLKRLEDEQREFRDFLEKLRWAKDRSEFDQFMADRKSRPQSANKPEPDSGQPAAG